MGSNIHHLSKKNLSENYTNGSGKILPALKTNHVCTRKAENKMGEEKKRDEVEGKRVTERQQQVRKEAEPKWVTISSYCKRHGVNREAVQCRKRWSNLAGDFRKIKEWESRAKEEGDSFWGMRNDLRRERKLPGFFDREIFEVLDKDTNITTLSLTTTTATTDLVPVKDEPMLPVDDDDDDNYNDDDNDEAVFDSGRTAAAEDGLFSDFERSKQDDHLHTPTTASSIPAPLPISERRYQPFDKTFFDSGKLNRKQPASASDPEKGSPSGEAHKRRRLSTDDGGDTTLQEQLVKVLESNNKMLAAQLEAQNANSHLDRDQRKDQGDSLIAVLNKLADALGKIADKI